MPYLLHWRKFKLTFFFTCITNEYSNSQNCNAISQITNGNKNIQKRRTTSRIHLRNENNFDGQVQATTMRVLIITYKHSHHLQKQKQNKTYHTWIICLSAYITFYVFIFIYDMYSDASTLEYTHNKYNIDGMFMLSRINSKSKSAHRYFLFVTSIAATSPKMNCNMIMHKCTAHPFPVPNLSYYRCERPFISSFERHNKC